MKKGEQDKLKLLVVILEEKKKDEKKQNKQVKRTKNR